MSRKVDINELKECIELNSGELDGLEEFRLYIDKESGEIISIPMKFDESIQEEKMPEDINEWEIADFNLGLDIKKNQSRYIQVPEEEYINEEEIIKEFCWSYKDENISRILKESINNGDLMRGFKKAIYDNNIYDQWYEYFDEKCFESIEKWCAENKLRYFKI